MEFLYLVLLYANWVYAGIFVLREEIVGLCDTLYSQDTSLLKLSADFHIVN